MASLVEHSSETGKILLWSCDGEKEVVKDKYFNNPDTFCDDSALFATLHSWQAECLNFYMSFIQVRSSHWLRIVSVWIQWMAINISSPVQLEFNIHKVQKLTKGKFESSDKSHPLHLFLALNTHCHIQYKV